MQATVQAKMPSTPSHSDQAGTVPPRTLAKAKVSSFDIVPEEKIDSIAERLELVERLIREYGRAYDYRSMTRRQLEAELDRLDAQYAPQRIESSDDNDREQAPIPPASTDSGPVSAPTLLEPEILSNQG